MLFWVSVPKSSPLCEGEDGSRVDRICMSKERRKYESFPAIVDMTVKIAISSIFFFFAMVCEESHYISGNKSWRI